MSHSGHDHDAEKNLSDGRLVAAIAVNLLLTVVEVVAGIFAGSLALLADAVHNFNDCASLVITLVARRVARKQADDRQTFGYRRAEVIGALINLTALIVVGIFLLNEALLRYLDPQPVEGWGMILAAGLALVVDLATVFFLYDMRRGGLNLRAGFLHKLSDALASVGVILGGVVILLWGLGFVDLVVTVVIAAYILYQGVTMIGQAIRILMEAAPEGFDLAGLVADMNAVETVEGVHHVHVWELSEEYVALEAHVVIGRVAMDRLAGVKAELKRMLADRYAIAHSTLEFELAGETCENQAVIQPHGPQET